MSSACTITDLWRLEDASVETECFDGYPKTPTHTGREPSSLCERDLQLFYTRCTKYVISELSRRSVAQVDCGFAKSYEYALPQLSEYRFNMLTFLFDIALCFPDREHTTCLQSALFACSKFAAARFLQSVLCDVSTSQMVLHNIMIVNQKGSWNAPPGKGFNVGPKILLYYKVFGGTPTFRPDRCCWDASAFKQLCKETLFTEPFDCCVCLII